MYWEVLDELGRESRQIVEACGCPTDIAKVCNYENISYSEDFTPTWIDGSHFHESGQDYILVSKNPSKPLGRRRFSAAHEVGHVLLRRMLKNEHTFNLDAENCYQPPAEQLCNEFAGMLLMPEDVVRECWDMVRVHRGGVMACAQWFGVTKSAMRMRLERLDLLPGFRGDEFYG